jgi:FkbM family methyltransferase
MSDIQQVKFPALKHVVASAICHPVIGEIAGWLFQEKIPSHGLRIDTSIDVDPTVKASLLWGIYERAEIRFIRQYLMPDLDVIELGSSLGVVSCQIAQKLSASACLICVEANPGISQKIRRNLDLNSVRNVVNIVHSAVSYSGEPTINFFIGDTNLVSALTQSSSATTKKQVPTTTLAQLVNMYDIGEYVLVSDIEGAELDMFLNEKHVLKQCRQMIIELHDTVKSVGMVTVEQMIEMLVSEHNFHLCARRGSVCVFDR